MDICFAEVSPVYVREAWPSYFHERARYFRIMKGGKPLCFYGVITRASDVGEAFLMIKTFQGKVLSKEFFMALFAHAGSLGYKELWTWTKWDRLINLFRRFRRLGIEEAGCPPWDKGVRKTWFVMTKVVPLKVTREN